MKPSSSFRLPLHRPPITLRCEFKIILIASNALVRLARPSPMSQTFHPHCSQFYRLRSLCRTSLLLQGSKLEQRERARALWSGLWHAERWVRRGDQQEFLQSCYGRRTFLEGSAQARSYFKGFSPIYCFWGEVVVGSLKRAHKVKLCTCVQTVHE